MFANLLELIIRKPPQACEAVFVEKVVVTRKTPRNRRVEQIIIAGWVLIALKSVLVIWAIHRWHVPFSPWWVIAPTVMLAALCTAIYIWRE